MQSETIPSPSLSRTSLVLGPAALSRLAAARVVVFGLGGVGSYAVEALARGGVGALDIVDADVIEESNINRQLYALHSTIGRAKVDAARERIADINPQCKVRTFREFYLPDNECASPVIERSDSRHCERSEAISHQSGLPLKSEIASRASQGDSNRNDGLAAGCIPGASYVVDAVDTVAAKVGIICAALGAGVPVISSMGTGNKTDPAKFTVADISQTSVCPLARAVRHALRSRGITSGVQVVYSTEKPATSTDVIGSVSFVPPVAGMIMAGRVIMELVSRRPPVANYSVVE